MNLQEEIDLQEKGKIARKNAKELICDKCIYIGQIKDGRDSFYCSEFIPTVIVIDTDYNNYTSGLHLSKVFDEEISDYCVDEATRMAYRRGIFDIIINKEK